MLDAKRVEPILIPRASHHILLQGGMLSASGPGYHVHPKSGQVVNLAVSTIDFFDRRGGLVFQIPMTQKLKSQIHERSKLEFGAQAMNFDHMCCVEDLICFVVFGDGLEAAIIKPMDNGGQSIGIKFREMINLRWLLVDGTFMEQRLEERRFDKDVLMNQDAFTFGTNTKLNSFVGKISARYETMFRILRDTQLTS
jgi:hypothetical protein